MKPEELVIIVRGGIVQSVLSSSLEYPIRIQVLDYDNMENCTSEEEIIELKELQELEEKIKDYFPIY